MLNDYIDFKEAVFAACVPQAESLIYWRIEASGFINPAAEREREGGRERYREPKRAQGYFQGLLIKYPIIACGAMALPP